MRSTAITTAVRLGLLWQAAFSTAMLVNYVRHGSSFYLSNIAGAWPYVHQHLLWIAAFVTLCSGAAPLARALAAGAAALSVVQIVSLAEGGETAYPVMTAIGVACFGVLPAIALLSVRAGFKYGRRFDWLVSGAIAAVVISLVDDGVLAVSSGGMRVGPARGIGVLDAVVVGWLACILVLAVLPGDDRRREHSLAALAATAHLLVVQVVWLTGDVLVRQSAGQVPLRVLPFTSLLRVLFLGAILAALLSKFLGKVEGESP